MAERINDQGLITLVVIALLITFIGVFSLSGDPANITGMTTKTLSELGDPLIVYIVLFLIVTTLIVSFLAMYVLKKK